MPCPLKSKKKQLKAYRQYPRYATLVLRAKYAYNGGLIGNDNLSIYDGFLMDLRVATKKQLTERALFDREDSKSVIERLLGIEIDEKKIRENQQLKQHN